MHCHGYVAGTSTSEGRQASVRARDYAAPLSLERGGRNERVISDFLVAERQHAFAALPMPSSHAIRFSRVILGLKSH
jgi:hypothetical protein